MKKTVFDSVLILGLLLAACTPAAEGTPAPAEEPAPSEAESLVGATWKWVGFTDPMQQFEVEDPASYTLAFQEDGTVAIQADCNNAIGSYTVDGQSLTIEVGPMTMAACPPGSKSDDFVKYLGAAATTFFEGGDLFIDLMADGGTMRFSSQMAGRDAGQLAGMGIDLNGEPFSGTLYVGGGPSRWLDPTLISTLGGTAEGSGVDASPLGESCKFFVPERPDVLIEWEEPVEADTLRVFFLSMGDPSLMLVTPDGQVMCSDDLNPLVLDPYLEIPNPEPGQYAAFMGAYEGEAVYPGFLVVTTHDINPATMDLARLFPREVDPRGVPEVLPLDRLELDSPDVFKPEGGKLAEENLPFTGGFSAGGDLGAFNLDQPNPLCTGFIDPAPTFSFEWVGGATPLVMYYESETDTTLQVLTPDGSFLCDDDIQGSANINPGLTFTPQNGVYHVWVGSFSPEVMASGALTITDDPAAEPAVLTFDDVN
jgi:heat shock protein HslJ